MSRSANSTTPQAEMLRPTPLQRRLHGHHLLHPDDGGLNLAYLYRYTGNVDAERLRAALESVLGSVHAFQVTFHEIGGQSRVRRHTGERPRVPLIDLPPGGEEELRRRLAERADLPIPPDRRPLYDCAVYRGTDAVYASLLISHLVVDAAGLYNLGDELARVYAEPELPPRVDVASDPITLASGNRPDPAAAEHFRRAMEGLAEAALPELEDSSAPGRPVAGRRVRAAPDPGLAAELDAALEAGEYRRFPFLLACYLVVLARLTGRTRVVAGVPVADRRTPQRQRAFGYFVNTLPLVIDLAEHQTFDALCRAVEREVDRLVEHRAFDPGDVPAGDGRTAPARRFAPNNAFTYYREPLALRLPGAATEHVHLERRRVTYPLCVQVENDPAGLVICAEYADRLHAARPGDCFDRVLRAAIRRPMGPLRELHLLDAAEQARIDALLNTRRTHHTPPSLAEWFERIAARHPDRTAVEGNGTRYSYAELNRTANRLARRLEQQVTSDHVGVAMRRRPELVAVLLACLKAGKTYVPLDPHGPPDRLRHIRERFGTGAAGTGLPVVTEAGLLGDVTGSGRLDFRQLADGAASLSGADRPRGDDRDRTAYVIFTSGSTGRPKGVRVSHRNVMRLFLAAESRFDFGTRDTWSLFHSFAFDFSVWEMYGALLHGGRLVIVPEEVRRSPEDFASFLREHRVTVLNQTPTAFRQLTSALDAESAAGLRVRHVVFGGEELRFDTLRPWFALMGDRARLVNMYGITETTVHVTFYPVTRRVALEQPSSLIGRPLDDLWVRVVDDELRPVPLGVPGELLVGGAGVAQGYLGDPELTSARFLRDLVPGEVLYRTGDLVRADADGCLTYLGRIDRQVQLRGYRIELGEIEAALRTVPGVDDCLVRVDFQDPTAPRLVACLAGSDAPQDSEVRARARLLLPEYMVPAVLQRVPALPVNVNGKVDETALPPVPAPAAPRPDTAAPGEESGGVAGRVTGIWRDVVPSASFGPHDNFFDIGGTSLHAVQLHRSLREEFGLAELQVIDLFEHTTVHRLTEYIEDRLAARPAAADQKRRMTL